MNNMKVKVTNWTEQVLEVNGSQKLIAITTLTNQRIN